MTFQNFRGDLALRGTGMSLRTQSFPFTRELFSCPESDEECPRLRVTCSLLSTDGDRRNSEPLTSCCSECCPSVPISRRRPSKT